MFLCAQDRHLADDPAASLYRASPFAHGYIHGYEDGFHQGTINLLSQEPELAKSKAPDGHKAYRDDFGDRDDFLQGYAAGFADGRADADERGFQANARMAELARGFNGYKKDAAARFDQGFESGYLMQRAGKGVESAACATGHGADHVEFCDGLRRGQLLAGETAPTTPAVASTGGVTGATAAVKPATATTTETSTEKPAAVAAPVTNTGGETPPQFQPF